MKTMLWAVLLASLLISGCGTTNLVTGAERGSGSIKFSPLLENPTLAEESSPAMAPARDDVCIGLISHLYF